jgi:hypothetical protein
MKASFLKSILNIVRESVTIYINFNRSTKAFQKSILKEVRERHFNYQFQQKYESVNSEINFKRSAKA